LLPDDEPPPTAELTDTRPRALDDGYFPAGQSLLREVMLERAVNLLYGQRSLVIGSLQPLAFIGTCQSSTACEVFYKRLTHTAEVFDAVFFGTREEADRALAFTLRLHQRVSGTIDEQAGPYAAGTPYSALDPELMMWVLAPLFDSARALYETFVRALTAAERERLYQEYLTFGELFGMPRDTLPATYDAFRDWWPVALADDRIFLTDRARAYGSSILMHTPVPRSLRPAAWTAGFLLRGTLPPVVRQKYGIGWNQAQQLAYNAIAASLRGSKRIVPSRLRRGPSAQAYQLVARAERARVRAGKGIFRRIGAPTRP
jgi:uncharacterized protein (DUF2236 family)